MKRIISILCVLVVFSNTALAATFTIDSDGDSADFLQGDGYCNSLTSGRDDPGFCTLRAAIEEADYSAVDADIVDFSATAITEGATINVGSVLTIDNGNFTLQNSSDNTVGLNGGGGAYNGFNIDGDNFTIDGDADGGVDYDPALYIYNFGGDGIEVRTSAEETQIKDVVVGFTAAGADSGNRDTGISVSGDDTLIDGVVVGNSTYSGIEMKADTATDMTVSNSKLGTNVAGTSDKGNGYGGVDIACSTCDGGSVNGDAGGSGGEGITITSNLLSGNTVDGIRVYTNDGTTGDMVISNNIIGLDTTGEDSTMGNSSHGIDVYEDVKMDLTISGNTISDNAGDGIQVQDGSSLTISNNIIGWDDEGVTAVGNTGAGIQADAETISITGNTIGNSGEAGISIPGTDATSVTIGGTTVTAYNVIGDNTSSGIGIMGNSNSTILGNYIGVDDDGITNIGNTEHGILIGGSGVTIIGGTGTYDGNVIGFNGQNGIYIFAAVGVADVTVKGNYIGVNQTGSANIGNMGSGIGIPSDGTVVIGGGGANDGNVIGNNAQYGISIGGAADTTIKGNYIGIYEDGSTDIGNTQSGILIMGTTADGPITIGGDNNFEASGTLGEGNVISNNDQSGISVALGGNILSILGNIIGLKKGISGTYDTASGNTGAGIIISSRNVSSLTIGGVGSSYASSKRNIIAGHVGTYGGIAINGLSSSAVGSIINNYIGLDINGSSVLSNINGIDIGSGVNGSSVTLNIGGTGSNEGNVIAGNTSYNINLSNTAGTVNVLGNKIGVNRNATSAFTNAGSGITIHGSGIYNIGNGSSGGGNVISGHTRAGIDISEASGTTSLQGNIIGLLYDLTELAYTVVSGNGSERLGPALNYSGIAVGSSVGGSVTIGGGDYTDANKRNVISGNYGSGIVSYLFDGLEITGNLIGLGSDGEDHDVGNVESVDNGSGIHLYNYGDVDNTIIGGDTALAGNLIAGNEGDGIWIETDDGTGTIDFTSGKIAYNIIGRDINGSSVPNDSDNDGNGFEIAIVAAEGGTLISALQIINNTLNTISHYGIYLYEVLSTSLYNSSYTYIPQNNTFSNPTSYTWQYRLSGVEQISGQCYDGYDNNSDGTIDSSDAGCTYSPYIEGNTSGDPVTTPQGAPLSLSYSSGSNSSSNSNSEDQSEEENSEDTSDDAEDTSEDDTIVEMITDMAENATEENANDDAETEEIANEDFENEEAISYEQMFYNEDNEIEESELNFEEMVEALEALELLEEEIVIPEELEQYVDLGEEIADAIADFENLSEEEADALTEEASDMANNSLQDAVSENVSGGGGGVSLNLGKGKVLNVDESNFDRVTFIPNYLSKNKKDEMKKKAEKEGKTVVDYGIGTDIGADNMDDAVQDVLGLPQIGADSIDDDDCDLACEIWANKDPFKKDDPNKSVIAVGSNFMKDKKGTPVVGKKPLVRLELGKNLKLDDKIIFKLVNSDYEEIYKLDDIQIGDDNRAAFTLEDDLEDGEYYGLLEINGEIESVTKFKVDRTQALDLELSGFEFLDKDSVAIGDPPEYMPTDGDTNPAGIGDPPDYMPKELTSGSLAGLKTSVINTDYHRVAVKAKNGNPVAIGDPPDYMPTPDFMGYAKPGSIVIATWKSRILSSTVLSDASQGKFELYIPDDLPEGDHEILVFIYDPSRSLVSNVTSLLFRK